MEFNTQQKKALSIYVHCASDYLTDYQSHGEGLICFSILNGLANRGHRVIAFTPKASIRNKSDNLEVIESSGPVYFNSLSPWKYAIESNKRFKQLSQHINFDIVWRMNPVGYGCPLPPLSKNKPLVIGPLYYKWKNNAKVAKPRFWVSLKKILDPLADMGWKKTLKNAKAIFCATIPHAIAMGKKYNKKFCFDIPLIVRPSGERKVNNLAKVRITFLANLLENKRPLEFCKLVKILKDNNVDFEAVIIGDGPERIKVENYIKNNQLGNNIQLLGRIPNDQVYKELKQTTFFINLSIGEPYGRNIVEAMSEGVVVISHASGGPKDFIKDGDTGILVESEQALDFSKAILDLISNADKVDQISKNALKRSQDWSSEKVISDLEQKLFKIAAS